MLLNVWFAFIVPVPDAPLKSAKSSVTEKPPFAYALNVTREFRHCMYVLLFVWNGP